MVTLEGRAEEPECSLTICLLTLDRYEYPDEASDALPVIPRALVFERPIICTWLFGPRENTTATIGTFQNLFTQGTPRLALGTLRKFVPRVSLRGPVGSHQGMDSHVEFKLVDLRGREEPVTFSFLVKQVELGDQGEYYYRSAPFLFGDGREPSLPMVIGGWM